MPTTADNNVIGITADIVAAYLTKNPVEGAALPALIQRVYTGLRATLAPTEPPEPTLEPAVSVKRSVFREAIVCLDCGQRLSMLKLYLKAGHGLSPDEYRARWGLAQSYPMTAPNYVQQRSEMAKEAGLGRKPGPPPLTIERVFVQQISGGKAWAAAERLCQPLGRAGFPKGDGKPGAVRDWGIRPSLDGKAR